MPVDAQGSRGDTAFAPNAPIVAALARAQAELTNPEKSLTATIPPRTARERSDLPLAALSAGLDIVRKSRGAHEIATVQTTAIDREAGLIRLTTVLAHSSGEWLSSEWPVCAISETAAPRRMGAALTYARRLRCSLWSASPEKIWTRPNSEPGENRCRPSVQKWKWRRAGGCADGADIEVEARRKRRRRFRGSR